jgi:hypothetical protein
MFDMSTLGDAADVNPVIKHVRALSATWFTVCGRNLITGLRSAASPRVYISSTCKVGQKLGLSLPLLTCSPSAWSSPLLYCRGRKSRRDLWITLYNVLSLWKEGAERNTWRQRKLHKDRCFSSYPSCSVIKVSRFRYTCHVAHTI